MAPSQTTWHQVLSRWQLETYLTLTKEEIIYSISTEY